MTEIVGCACGRDHEEMPYDDEYGELVCREHKRHIPCRECRRRIRDDD